MAHAKKRYGLCEVSICFVRHGGCGIDSEIVVNTADFSYHVLRTSNVNEAFITTILCEPQ